MGLLYRTLRGVGKPLLRLFYRHRILGEAHLLGEGAIIASNHTSFLDPVVIGFSWPDEIFFLARATLFQPALFGWFLRTVHAYPVQSGRDSAGAFRAARELIAQGKKVVIFPEGQRTETTKIGPLKRGAALLASQANCSAIPIYIDGVYEVWSRKSWLPKPWGRITVVIGNPIAWSTFAHLPREEAQREFTEALRTALIDLQTSISRTP